MVTLAETNGQKVQKQCKTVPTILFVQKTLKNSTQQSESSHPRSVLPPSLPPTFRKSSEINWKSRNTVPGVLEVHLCLLLWRCGGRRSAMLAAYVAGKGCFQSRTQCWYCMSYHLLPPAIASSSWGPGEPIRFRYSQTTKAAPRDSCLTYGASRCGKKHSTTRNLRKQHHLPLKSGQPHDRDTTIVRHFVCLCVSLLGCTMPGFGRCSSQSLQQHPKPQRPSKQWRSRNLKFAYSWCSYYQYFHKHCCHSQCDAKWSFEGNP